MQDNTNPANEAETPPVTQPQPSHEPDQLVDAKEKLLKEIRAGLSAGVVSDDEVRQLLVSQPQVVVSTAASSQPGVSVETHAPAEAPDAKESKKISPVEAMFDIAGLVLFASLMSAIAQTWEDGHILLHLGLSAGVGALLWWLAYYLNSRPTSETRKGIQNALIVTGMLSIISGAFIAMTYLVGDGGDIPYVPAAITFGVLGAIHFLYDRLVRKDLVILMGLVLLVVVFPTLLFGILADADVPVDVWSLVAIASTALLLRASRLLGRLHPDRPLLKAPFDTLGAFLILGTMYVSSFSDYGVIWQVLLIAGIFGMFYLSIVRRSKQFLGNASVFLVLTIITISFRYFSGAGVTASLIISAFGLLASAAIASSINKKYIKT